MSKWKKSRKMEEEDFGGLTYIHNAKPSSFGELKKLY